MFTAQGGPSKQGWPAHSNINGYGEAEDPMTIQNRLLGRVSVTVLPTKVHNCVVKSVQYIFDEITEILHFWKRHFYNFIN